MLSVRQGDATALSTASAIQEAPGTKPRRVFQISISIASILRAVSNSCSGRRTSSSAMSRKYIPRKLTGSSSLFERRSARGSMSSTSSSSSTSASVPDDATVVSAANSSLEISSTTAGIVGSVDGNLRVFDVFGASQGDIVRRREAPNGRPLACLRGSDAVL